MTSALYQRFRPVAAFRAILHRRRLRRDLQSELAFAIEERDSARRQYTQQLDWNVCQSQNIGECHRQIEALRAAAVAMLRRAVRLGDGCACPAHTDACEAWRALGFEGHFDADKAADLLPLVKP